MNQSEFINQHSGFWKESEDKKPEELCSELDLPATYRVLSHHLALAETRNYSEGLIRYLQHLVLKYHSLLYSYRKNWFSIVWLFFYKKFQDSIRENRIYIFLASACFFIPLILTAIAVYFFPDIVYYIISIENIAEIKEMYNPDNAVLGRERADEGDWYMFGYYIYNNTSIGFRTFAAGLLMGFGTVFFLLFNAVYIGMIAGYLINIGYSETFFSFVSGHSSFELLAIALSGAAGMMLGNALINPANLKRKQALQKSAKLAMPIMQGAMSCFFIAAAIEAFWSSNKGISLELKAAIGLILWLSIILYFIYFGKNRIAK